MKYRVELRERDQFGDLIPNSGANMLYPTLYRAWAAAMKEAQRCSVKENMLVCVRVFDQFNRLAVTGRAAPNLARSSDTQLSPT